ncbi:MAG: hypothetical protein ACON5F_13835 [Jejuia sp.]
MKANIPQEKLVLNLNDELFVSGETLYYKVFCLNEETNRLSNLSKVAYVELMGIDKNVLFKHKLKLENGMSYSQFFIPANTPTGNYKLLAYTQWMKNNEVKPFFIKDIYVVSPYITLPKVSDDIVGEKYDIEIEYKAHKDLNTNKSRYFDLRTDSNQYTPRSKGILNIENLIGNAAYGNYSLYIREVDSVFVKGNSKIDLSNNFVKSDTRFFLPEIRGEIISGKVVSKENKNYSKSNVIVSLSIPESNPIFKNVSTDENGRFFFNLHETYTSPNLILRILHMEQKDLTILLDNKDFDYYGALKFNTIHLNSNIENWLINRSIKNQLENAYSEVKRDSTIPITFSNSFYGKPSISYKLDDYKRFPTVRETFKEVIEGAGVRKNKDNYALKVYYDDDLERPEFDNYEPLILVDGIVIQDNSHLMRFSPFKIETINLLKGVYFNGPSIFNGVIDVITKERDFFKASNIEGLNSFDISLFQEKEMYYTPNYDLERMKLKRIPDYRHQLIWYPDITLKDEAKSIEFYTSDVTGFFEIVLEGFGLDGNYIGVKTYIEVKN